MHYKTLNISKLLDLALHLQTKWLWSFMGEGSLWLWLCGRQDIAKMVLYAAKPEVAHTKNKRENHKNNPQRQLVQAFPNNHLGMKFGRKSEDPIDNPHTHFFTCLPVVQNTDLAFQKREVVLALAVRGPSENCKNADIRCKT